MAINVNFDGATIRKPGAYTKTQVNLTGGFPLTPTGIVALVGEADAGEPGVVKTYTSEDLAAAVNEYGSGPIVDALRMAVAPAKDSRVPNGASIIRVYKTNASTKATRDLLNANSDAVFNVSSANWGEDENLIAVKVEAGSSPKQRILTITKNDVTETLSENPAEVVMTVTYKGSDEDAELSVTNVSGVKTLNIKTATKPEEDITIPLTGKTVQTVVDMINNHGGTPGDVYEAETDLRGAAYLPADLLDYVTTPESVKVATKLYKAQRELLDIIAAESVLITAELVAGEEGLPEVTNSKLFLSGGTRGASSNSSFQAAFDALMSVRCNTVVPLVSRDATDLAAVGETDPSSTFTVDAVNLQAVTHCITASNTKNRSERNCYVSKKSTFADAQEASRDIGHERASMLFQDVLALNSEGDLAQFDPWAAAVMLAGIQAGTPTGTPATFKNINALGISHQDYNFKTQVDLAIDAGLLPLEEAETGGIRVVVHNTTYGRDPNFVYNRVSVLEAADVVAYNLRQQLEAIFVGRKVSSSLANDVRQTVESIMSTFLSAQIIVGDDTNRGLGYKDLAVKVMGNTVYIDITITPVQGVDFVLSRITLDTIQQSA